MFKITIENLSSNEKITYTQSRDRKQEEINKAYEEIKTILRQAAKDYGKYSANIYYRECLLISGGTFSINDNTRQIVKNNIGIICDKFITDGISAGNSGWDCCLCLSWFASPRKENSFGGELARLTEDHRKKNKGR